MRSLLFTVITFIALTACAEKQPAQKAEATLIDNKGTTIGHASFTQGTQGVVIRIKAKDLSPGIHGMHFHKTGECSDHDHFKKAGGHIDPHSKPHGFFHPEGPHEGNLPNLIVHQDGTAETELYSSLVSLNGENNVPALLDKDGSTLIIHTNEDDHKTQPIGGAGGRIACGVIYSS